MIIIVKMCFGGLGQNFLNPALGARAFLVASWPGIMTNYVNPGAKLLPVLSPDAVSSATPLSGEVPVDYISLLLGNVGGCIEKLQRLPLDRVCLPACSQDYNMAHPGCVCRNRRIVFLDVRGRWLFQRRLAFSYFIGRSFSRRVFHGNGLFNHTRNSKGSVCFRSWMRDINRYNKACRRVSRRCQLFYFAYECCIADN